MEKLWSYVFRSTQNQDPKWEYNFLLLNVLPLHKEGDMKILKYEMLCAIWYHLYNFKKVKNTHGGVTYWHNASHIIMDVVDTKYFAYKRDLSITWEIKT